MLTEKMVIPCTIYKRIYNAYGDLRKTEGVTTTCWFRDVSMLEHNTDRDSDSTFSMAWLRPTEDLEAGDLLTIDGRDYAVQQAIKARRIGETQVQFIKCTLTLQSGTVS